MASPAMPPMRVLTVEEARAAVQEGLAEFEKPENRARMEAAISAAGGDPSKLMTFVMPVGLEIQGGLLVKYGFPPNMMGAMQMIMAIRMAAGADPDLAVLVNTLQMKLMGK